MRTGTSAKSFLVVGSACSVPRMEPQIVSVTLLISNDCVGSDVPIPTRSFVWKDAGDTDTACIRQLICLRTQGKGCSYNNSKCKGYGGCVFCCHAPYYITGVWLLASGLCINGVTVLIAVNVR